MSRVRFPAWKGFLFFCRRYQTASEVHPVFFSVGTGRSYPGLKRPGREANKSPPPSAEVRNAWSYTSSHSVRLHGVVRR
jgi:hypothetical protein